MLDFFAKLFRADFMSHGHCYLWRPEVAWLHVVSDLLIALAYYFIPFAILFIVRKRRDFAYPWMLLLFGIFILACGTTHLMSVWVVWHPVYRLDGIIKAITAAASVPTAILLMRIAPSIVKLPSAEELRMMNDKLEREIEERKLAEGKVRELNAELERRVEQRTTELELSNRKLRASELRLKAILDTAPLLVFIKDRDWKYVFGNRHFFQVFGKAPEDVVGRTDFDLWTRELAESYRNSDADVFNTLAPIEREEKAIYGNATHTYMSVKFPLLDENGAAYAMCGISTDITERKRAEQSLRQYNQELEQFAFIAAHDLQEPLRSVKSYTQLLAKRYKGALDSDADDYIHFVTTGVDRMVTLIRGLQSYTTVTHRHESALETVDISTVVQDTLRDLQSVIQENNASITVGFLPKLCAHAGQLSHVFQNLISNSLKYRSEAVPHIEIYGEQRSGECEYVVKDNGIGFDMRYADRIFGVFKRLHGHEYPGAGIGLAIVKKIVDLHEGRVWVVSEMGKGSEFHFALPRGNPV